MTVQKFDRHVAYTGRWWEGQGRYDNNQTMCEDRSKAIYEYCAYRYLPAMANTNTIAEFIKTDGTNATTAYPSQVMGGCKITIKACRLCPFCISCR